MSKLYQITQEYSDVCDAIMEVFEANPDLDEASKQQIIADNLSSIQQGFETKALGLAGYIQNLKLEQYNVKELQDRFTKRSRNLDKTITQLSDYLLIQMQQVKVPKLSNSWLTVQV
ncbi:MAG: siphovirus Gp157 family protein, partial [Methylococcaceae bacterium]